MPPGHLFYVAPSPIHGRGVFASQSLAEGTPVVLAIRGNEFFGQIQPEARFVNHSKHAPNLVMIRLPQAYWLVVAEDVVTGTELTVDYWKTPWYVAKPNPAWDL